jgi:hypothetical protein
MKLFRTLHVSLVDEESADSRHSDPHCSSAQEKQALQMVSA